MHSQENNARLLLKVKYCTMAQPECNVSDCPQQECIILLRMHDYLTWISFLSRYKGFKIRKISQIFTSQTIFDSHSICCLRPAYIGAFPMQSYVKLVTCGGRRFRHFATAFMSRKIVHAKLRQIQCRRTFHVTRRDRKCNLCSLGCDTCKLSAKIVVDRKKCRYSCYGQAFFARQY